MVKLKHLLTETPDTLRYDGEAYDYSSDYNKLTFFRYHDIKDNVDGYFGFNAPKSTFICDREIVVKELMEAVNDNSTIPLDLEYYKGSRYQFASTVRGFFQDDSAGGHYPLRRLLMTLRRLAPTKGSEPNIRGRVFDISAMFSKPTIFVSFWEGASIVKPFKTMWDTILTTNGYDPKTVMYETKNDQQTYSELYGENGYKDQLSLGGEIGAVGKEVESEIAKEIKKKNDELAQASGDLHVTGATLSQGEKKRLQNKIWLLQAEVDLLNKAKTEGKTTLADVNLQKAVLAALEKQPRTYKDLYMDVIGSLEKLFPTMTYAQIRQHLQDKHIDIKSVVKSTLKEIMESKKKLKFL